MFSKASELLWVVEMIERLSFDYREVSVLITGGTRGIGYAIADQFCRAGAEVVVTGRAEDPASYSRDLSAFRYERLNLEESTGIAPLVERLGKLDILVNNAGSNLPDGQDEWQPEVFERSLRINLFGAFQLAQAFKPKLQSGQIEGGSSVINLASMASFFAIPMVPGYGAAKAGIVQMTKTLAAAWAADGIRVNAVAPGLIDSDLTSAMKGVDSLERPFIERTPMRRWGKAEEIAPAVLFLTSPAAAFITGETLRVDGGYSISG